MVTIGLSILAIVALLVEAIATRPAAFCIERSLAVAAPAPRVFSFINDFRRWSQWSPYDKADPSLQKAYGGAPEGVGASLRYASKRFGEGWMTITASEPAERVAIDAEFTKPFRNRNHIEFLLQPCPEGVLVTWGIRGRHGFLMKALSAAVSVDLLIGQQFERGLAELKTLAEARSSQEAPPSCPFARWRSAEP